MFRKFLPFLVLGPVANLLWVLWVAPAIGELGGRDQMLEWIAVQMILPLVFSLFLLLRRKFILWVLLVYGAFVALYALGLSGWALMGAETPVSVYVVSLVLFVMSFGLIYQSLQGLNIGKKEKYYGFED